MMRKNKMVQLLLSVFLVGFLVLGACSKSNSSGTVTGSQTTVTDWKPSRTVTMYLYSGAGGDTDTACRALAAVWQDYFGTPFTVVNMPGGGGGIAANQVYGQPADGHTLFGMAEGVNSMNVIGAFEHKTDVWNIMVLFSGKGCIGVPADSPYKTIDDLVQAAKTRNIKVSCSSTGSIWHIKSLQLAQGTDTKFNILPYDGSNQAIVGLLSRESDVVVSSVGEQMEYILSGRIRPLATIEREDGNLDGYGPIPSITKSFPKFGELPVAIQWNGIGMRADTPDHIKVAYEKAFLAAIKTENITKLEKQRGTSILGRVGAEAKKVVDTNNSSIAWILDGEGITTTSPEKYDIPRP